MNVLRVDFGARSYDVVVGTEILESVPELVEKVGKFKSLALIADEKVDDLYGDSLAKRLQETGRVHRLRVPSGEKSKKLSQASDLLERLADMQLRRNDLVITLGGGMVSDLGGFVAAIYQRGVGVVHVSTSLLGQVDAAIGGKTGVNLKAGKNLAGAFHQPRLVICDVALLQTLPDREFRSGLAEVIKYGLCFDPSILELVKQLMESGGSTNTELLEKIVHRCASLKAEVVSNDETDQSGRIFLNYGHTLGHALEAAQGFAALTHGEAISVGMMFAAKLASHVGLMGSDEVNTHATALGSAGLPLTASFDPKAVRDFWSIDKKNEGLQRWVLLEKLGKPSIHSNVPDEHIDAALREVAA